MRKNYLLVLLAILLTANGIAQNIPSYVPKDGLIGYWPLDGDVSDLSSNKNNGQSNKVIWGKNRFGQLNNSSEFNSVYERYIQITNPKNMNGSSFTYNFWMKTNTQLSYYNSIIDMVGTGIYIQMYGPHPSYSSDGMVGKIGLSGYLGYNNSNKTVNDGNWHNITLIADFIQGNGTYYIDGVLDNTIKFKGFKPNDCTEINIGQSPTTAKNSVTGPQGIFSGQLDDIAIWNRALNELEIKALFNSCTNPTVAITPSDSTTFCQGGSAILTAAVTTASTPIYQWYNNDQAITNATQNTYKASTAGKYTVKVVDGACEAVSLPKEVTVNPLPTATISPSGNVSKICEGSTLTLVADGGVSYKWNTGATENKITVSKKGPYYADVINQFGCKSVVWQDIVVEALPVVTINNLKQIAFKNEVSILLEGAPKGGVFTGEGVSGNTFNPEKAALGKKAITYTYSSTNGCKGEAKETILLVDSLGNVCSSTKYDTVIVNKTKYDTVIVPKTVTKYDTVIVKTNVFDTVRVNKYDTITVTDTVNILKINFKLTTGIKANQMTNMSIYPNPTSDVLIIDASDLAAITGYSYRILDVLGKEVYNALVTVAKTEISLKTLGAKGMYLLHILDANKQSVQTKQIILE